MSRQSSRENLAVTDAGGWEQAAARMLTYLCLAVASLYILFWLIVATQTTLYPHSLGYTEGAVLDQALRLARGQQIYVDVSTPPYRIANFPPVFIGLWAALARFAGPVFWPGRLIAALSTMSIALCVWWIVKHFTTDRWAGLLAAGCFLWGRPMRAWTGLALTDSLAIACAVAGLAVIIKASPQRRWLAVPFFVLAFFTKQTMVAAPAAAYLYLWLKGDRKQAGTLLIAHTAAIGIIFALLQWWTRGHFWTNVIGANLNDWQWHFFRKYTRELVESLPVVLALAFAGTLIYLPHDRLRVTALYFLTSSTVAITVGKVGGYWNYFIEVTAVASIMVGVMWALARPDLRLPRLGSARIVLASVILFQFASMWWRPPLRLQPANVDAAAQAQLERIVAAEPGEVLSEDMGVVARAEKQMWLRSFVTTQMSRAGWWDQSSILQMLRAKFFSLIIVFDLPGKPPAQRSLVFNNRWTKEEMLAMAENYELWQRVGQWCLLRPRQEAELPTRPVEFDRPRPP